MIDFKKVFKALKKHFINAFNRFRRAFGWTPKETVQPKPEAPPPENIQAKLELESLTEQIKAQKIQLAQNKTQLDQQTTQLDQLKQSEETRLQAKKSVQEQPITPIIAIRPSRPKQQSKDVFRAAIYKAIQDNDVTTISYLVREKQEIPLEYLAIAILKNQVDIAKMLIDHVGNIETIYRYTEQNPFVKEASQASIKPFTLSLLKGGEFSFAEAALIYVSCEAHTKMAPVLLEKIKDISVNIHHIIYEQLPKKSPCEYLENSKEILQLFFQRRIIIPITNNAAMSYAIQSGSVDIINHSLESFHQNRQNYECASHKRQELDRAELDLFQIRGIGWNDPKDASNIIEYAMAHGQTKAAITLHYHLSKLSNTDLLQYALKCGNEKMVGRLLRERSEHCPHNEYSKYCIEYRLKEEDSVILNNHQEAILNSLTEATTPHIPKAILPMIAEYAMPDVSEALKKRYL